ncbi:TPM domain-containing protein [Altibacter sp. HG106]|nr:TPM domain-containing protein [Altibacter sp. HG106]MDC7994351.1 TPM domain-containing protein [Altibacter sp. HG106]
MMNPRMPKTCLCWLVFLFGTLSALAQYDIPELPKQQTSVYDYIELLSPTQKSSLERKLVGYADSTSTQIVVAIIGTTKGEDISMLGARWGQQWGIGQADEDNGILILLAKDDRKIDINTGYGIEYRVTDLMAERIINRIMIPEFKKGDFYSGLDQGADALFAALRGEFKEDRKQRKDSKIPYASVIILLFFILIIILRSRGGGKGGRGGGGSLLDVIILSNMGRTGGYSSGGGSFGGGGGFSGGFGGGGFGGGGASGGW